jgi:hypothetical protein
MTERMTMLRMNRREIFAEKRGQWLFPENPIAECEERSRKPLGVLGAEPPNPFAHRLGRRVEAPGGFRLCDVWGID